MDTTRVVVGRIPAGAPFVLGWSRGRLALLFAVAAATIEVGVALRTDPARWAGLFGSWWVHGLIATPLLIGWLILARQGPVLALGPAGLWVSVRGWPRPAAVHLQWSDVVAIRGGRFQWHGAVGIVASGPATAAIVDHLGAAGRATLAGNRKAYRTDLSASLSLADRSARDVVAALRTWAPAGLRWEFTLLPRRGSAACWAGRTAVAAGWVVVVLFGAPMALTNEFALDPDGAPATFVGYLCGVGGVALLPWIFTDFEAVVARLFLGGLEVRTNDPPA